ADRLRAERGDHVPLLDQLDDPDVRGVQGGRQGVAGEVGVADQAAGGAQVLGERGAHALGDARFDAGGELGRVEHAAHVLGDGQFHDPYRAQFDVDVDDRADRAEGEADEGVALAGLVQGFGGV